MNVNMKRSELIKVYRTDTWKQKVKHMPDDQVHAVYARFKRERKL